jgi:hypothetical protein
MRRKIVRTESAKRKQNFFKDNGLSLALAALFVITLFGESFFGLKYYNDQQSNHGASQISFGKFLATGTFLDGVFSNWQAAILQLAILIIFSTVLFQRGASHSRKPENDGKKKKDAHWYNWLYRNSLSLAFIFLFLTTFLLHLIFGTQKFNEEQKLQGQKLLTTGQFFCSAKFWFSVFQTWEAEFFAILIFLILTIFLRQENSAESKPLRAADKNTGEANK